VNLNLLGARHVMKKPEQLVKGPPRIHVSPVRVDILATENNFVIALLCNGEQLCSNSIHTPHSALDHAHENPRIRCKVHRFRHR
jgi:hypothetical protein